jgi:16S rRNA (guanine1207-N2)-methyltransferase
LNRSGQALFVVNNFIPLEQKAKAYFRYIDVLANNGSFKLVALAHQPVKN